MRGLSHDLYNRCQDALLRCSEFNSHTSLQAVFVTEELRPFRSGLPETDNKKERINQTIAYLLDKRLKNGCVVLYAFLTVLQHHYSIEDELHTELEEICCQLEQEFKFSPVASSQNITITQRRLVVWGGGVGIILMIGLITVISASLGSYHITPTPSAFSYQVHVQDRVAGKDISNAEITIEVNSIAPIRCLTDTKGLARCFIPSVYIEQPARITIKAKGYERYVLEGNLNEKFPLQIIQLAPSP